MCSKPGPGRLLMDGSVIDVTHKEFYLALLFFRNIGRPLSRAYIHEAVWIRETAVPSRTMDTHVSRVRNKLQLQPGKRLPPGAGLQLRLPPGKARRLSAVAGIGAAQAIARLPQYLVEACCAIDA